MYKHFGINYDPDRFKIWYSPCERESMPWTEEIKIAADIIARSTNKDIWVCLSGGIDSEVVARTLKNNNIPFRALIARFPDDLNAHDIGYAIEYCETNGVDYKIFDFDMIKFLREGYKTYMNQNLVSNNVFRYYAIELLQQIENMNGYAILGGRSAGIELQQKRIADIDPNDDPVCDTYDIGSLAPLEWCRKNNLDHCVFFYQASSEIHAAYLKEPVNQLLINNPYMLRSGWAGIPAKTLIFRSHFPELKPRIKYHGFEKIIDLRISTQFEMARYFGLDADVQDKRFKNLETNNQIATPVSQVQQQLGLENFTGQL
jgi:hypothetical protein